MGQRTISNLSRELKISRPAIYRRINKLGIEKKREYTVSEYKTLKESLADIADASARRRSENKVINQINIEPVALCNKSMADISQCETSSVKEMLKNAKQEYDYNRRIITELWNKIDNHIENFGKTTITAGNGTMIPIPELGTLEKFDRLNMALSRLISELEEKLGYDITGEDDPFE